MHKEMLKSEYRNGILLCLILVFALVLGLTFFPGIDESDSLNYAEFTNMIARGEPLE